jgi:exodeoxyribonuclease VII small subunit
MSSNEYGTFAQVRTRLDEIVVEVRNKEIPLEKSLDLYEEAIKLGNRCAELVDKPDFTEEEAQAAREIIDSETPGVTISGEPTEVIGASESFDGSNTTATDDVQDLDDVSDSSE